MNNNIVIAESLSTLAAKINVAVMSAQSAAKDAVQHALQAGRLLIEAKDQLPHGQWESWLAEHCEVSPRTARAYMRVAKMLPALENGNAVAVLPLRQALQAIATPPADPAQSERIRPPQAQDSAALQTLSDAEASLKRAERNLGMARTGLQELIKTGSTGRGWSVQAAKTARQRLVEALEVVDGLLQLHAAEQNKAANAENAT